MSMSMKKTPKLYEYTFQDGYFCYSRRMSREDLYREELEHGKLITKEPIYPLGSYRTRTGEFRLL